jgi:hypothetical protein
MFVLLFVHTKCRQIALRSDGNRHAGAFMPAFDKPMRFGNLVV